MPALIGLLTLASCGTETVACPTGQTRVGSTCTIQTGQLVIHNPNNYNVLVAKDNGQWDEQNTIPQSQWSKLEVGDYFVQFSKQDYTSQIVYAKIVANQPYTITAPPLQPLPGGVEIRNPNNYNYSVTITNSAGEVMTPDEYKALPPGNYTATFGAPGFQSDSFSFPVFTKKITPIKVPPLKPLT